jgi:transposase
MTVKNHHTLKQLLSLAKTEKDKHLAVRIQVVALAKQGLTCPTIVEMTGYCRRTIQRWIARYNQYGIKALSDGPRSGRPLKLPVEQYEQFCARVDAGPNPSERTARLYGRDIQHILKEEFGVVYSLDGIYKLLHRLGYSCLRPRPRHEKADPAAQEAFKKTSQRGWMPSRKRIPASA